MKEASSELIEFLASAESDTLRMADLYTFTLTNGTVLRYTSADFDIIYNGNIYSCKNAGISRDDTTRQVGLSVDDEAIELNPSDDDLLGTVPLVEAFRNGTFDNAWLQIDIAFYKDGWTQAPLILEKDSTGNVNVEDIGGSYVKLNLQAPTSRLSKKFPPDLYQTSCHYALYGPGCNVNKTNFAQSSSVQNGSAKKLIICNLSQAAGYFQNGVIAFTSGQNLNVKKSIKMHTSGVLTLSTPLQYAPAIGDTFIVYAGCDKTMTTCKNKFQNLDNFSGCPFIPNPDSILG